LTPLSKNDKSLVYSVRPLKARLAGESKELWPVPDRLATGWPVGEMTWT
jgi:hypothetical protein